MAINPGLERAQRQHAAWLLNETLAGANSHYDRYGDDSDLRKHYAQVIEQQQQGVQSQIQSLQEQVQAQAQVPQEVVPQEVAPQPVPIAEPVGPDPSQLARGDARRDIYRAFRQRGSAPEDYKDLITRLLDDIQGAIPSDVDNFGTYYEDAVGGAVKSAEDRDKRRFTRRLNQIAPIGFEDEAFNPNMDDDLLSSILDTQRSEAQSYIDRAGARGQLNDVGLKDAMRRLDEANTAGSSRLQDIGGGVLSGYRDQLSSIAEKGRVQAGGHELGGSFKPGGVRRQIRRRTRNLGNRLEGDIRGKLGGEQLFDFSSMIQKGGGAQGMINPAGSGFGIKDALRQNRTLGNQGVF